MSELTATIQNTIHQLQGSKLNNPALKKTPEDKAALAAQEFESVFISQMLTPMFEGIKTDGMFGGGSSEDIYKSMMLEEYGKLIAANGGIGIASSVKTEIIEMQAKQQGGVINGD